MCFYYWRKFKSWTTLWKFGGTLGDKDIKRLLGFHIFIYPFDEKNLQAASYDLTASKCAFVIEGGEQKLIIKDDKIVVPRGKTAVIETNESIYVSKKIAGTYHSLVSMSNKGFGHIGTTLDPGYFGISAISLQNNTDKDIEIDFGDKIATLMFYKTLTKSSRPVFSISGRLNDGIKLDVDKFYDFNYENKNENKITLILDKSDIPTGKNTSISVHKNKVVVKRKDKNGAQIEKEWISYNYKEETCNACRSCNDNHACKNKIIKDILCLENSKNEIRKDLKKWKNEDYISSKNCLIDKVKEDIMIKNIESDIMWTSIWGIFLVLVSVITICLIASSNISENYTKYKELYAALIATIPATIAILISSYSSYKRKQKEEYLKKIEINSRCGKINM